MNKLLTNDSSWRYNKELSLRYDSICLRSNFNPSRQRVYCHFIYELNTLLISLNRCKSHFHNCYCIVYIHFPAQKPQLLLYSQHGNVVPSLLFEWQVISLLDIKGVRLACLPSTDESTRGASTYTFSTLSFSRNV